MMAQTLSHSDYGQITVRLRSCNNMTHSHQECDSVFVCAAVSLRDDFRAYLPELLPRFIGLFAEAERSGSYDQVPAALHALEALGGALEDHLQLLLPALVRLICIGKWTQK